VRHSVYFLVIPLMFAPYAWGEWVSVAIDRGSVYLDKDSIKRNGTVVTAKYVLDLGGKCSSWKENRRGPSKRYCSQIWLTDFDCQRKLFRYQSSITMSGEMGQGEIVDVRVITGTTLYGAEFSDVTKFKPNESTSAAFQLACQFGGVNR